MMNVKIICVGKLKEDYLKSACAEYEKRLKGMCRLTVTELSPESLPDNPSPALIEAALKNEGERILSKLAKDDYAVALCIEGKEESSEKLAENIEKLALEGNSTVAFIIGSSHGLSPEVKNRARKRLSMSPMTFPHQLARVMLLEQIYRAFSIINGSKYHK